MKEKRIITIDEVTLCVRTDESPEALGEIVDRVNRSMRSIHTHAKNCSKVEAAIICALDYCSEAMRYRREYEALLTDYQAINAKLKERTQE